MWCIECEGEGKAYEVCTFCSGSGEGSIDGSRCPMCKGQGMVYTECKGCGGTGEDGRIEE